MPPVLLALVSGNRWEHELSSRLCDLLTSGDLPKEYIMKAAKILLFLVVTMLQGENC